MNTATSPELDASHLLHAKLATSRVGLRWERILRTHAHELDSLKVVYPEVRRHMDEALRLVATAQLQGRPLDDATIAMATTVLDDLQRLGGFELQHAAVAFRDELSMARGRSLDDVLAC